MAAYTISPVTPADDPRLVALHTAAFQSDAFSNLMLLNRPPGTHETLMIKSLAYWRNDPSAQLIKASRPDGTTVGWACWIRRQFPKVQGQSQTTASSSKPSDVNSGKADQPVDRSRALGSLMRDDQTRQEEQHLAGKTVLILQALATDPEYQKQGVAACLVSWGTQQADKEGLACWAHASPSGSGLYFKNGFEEVGQDVYNLREWLPENEEKDGWGEYVFRYMLKPTRISESAVKAAYGDE